MNRQNRLSLEFNSPIFLRTRKPIKPMYKAIRAPLKHHLNRSNCSDSWYRSFRPAIKVLFAVVWV